MPGKSSFQEIWLEHPDYEDWILEIKEDKHTAGCSVTLKNIDLASMRAFALKSHMVHVSRFFKIYFVSCSIFILINILLFSKLGRW